MNYEIKPQIGLGPIKFGMSPKDISEILGRPLKTSIRLSKNETDKDVIQYNGNQHSAWYGKDTAENADMQITYLKDKAIIITIFKQSGPLEYRDMNLHKKKIREEVLDVLAEDEDIYYYNERTYFFPKVGLIIPTPNHMKRFFFIQLVLSETIIPRLEFDMYEPSTALD